MSDEIKLGALEILRVTPEGQFIWHPEAESMIEEGDFSHSPALPHICRALRKKRTWIGLTEDDIFSVLGNLQAMYNRPPTEDSRVIFAQAIEAKLKEKNERSI